MGKGANGKSPAETRFDTLIFKDTNFRTTWQQRPKAMMSCSCYNSCESESLGSPGIVYMWKHSDPEDRGMEHAATGIEYGADKNVNHNYLLILTLFHLFYCSNKYNIFLFSIYCLVCLYTVLCSVVAFYILCIQLLQQGIWMSLPRCPICPICPLILPFPHPCYPFMVCCQMFALSSSTVKIPWSEMTVNTDKKGYVANYYGSKIYQHVAEVRIRAHPAILIPIHHWTKLSKFNNGTIKTTNNSSTNSRPTRSTNSTEAKIEFAVLPSRNPALWKVVPSNGKTKQHYRNIHTNAVTWVAPKGWRAQISEAAPETAHMSRTTSNKTQGKKAASAADLRSSEEKRVYSSSPVMYSSSPVYSNKKDNRQKDDCDEICECAVHVICLPCYICSKCDCDCDGDA